MCRSADQTELAVCVHRDIEVLASDLPAIVEQLCQLSDRECRTAGGPVVDCPMRGYTATMDVFDVDTERVLVTWTATFPVPDLRTELVQAMRDAVFRDFVDELRRTGCAAAS
ncbi:MULTISPECIES: hypothetical protein [unclassified Mycobacterium]|uniref:hypothetical protein n=1 Tax=unclassified Mycobacterium TaxID=2642494 RepID=UPI0029C80BA4|nr:MULTISPECIES: hypothetical protein [unclassified Mycobacterium]